MPKNPPGHWLNYRLEMAHMQVQFIAVGWFNTILRLTAKSTIA